MNRRAIFLGVLLAAFAILILGYQGSNAGLNSQTKSTRFKTVQVEGTQYIWELVSLKTGAVICQAIVDHPSRPTYEETITICGDQIFPREATRTPMPGLTPTVSPTPTSTAGPTPTVLVTGTPSPTEVPFDLAEFFKTVIWRLADQRQFTRTVQVPLPEMIINLSIPSKPANGQFFVTLSAYEPAPGEKIVGIYGTLNGWEFSCPSDKCDVPLPGTSVIEFWSRSSLGDDSRHTQATLRKILTNDGYTYEVSSIVPPQFFSDACAAIWTVPPGEQNWAGLPASPADLNTLKPYQYLASNLISARIVDTSGCPGGGYSSDGAPNACGLEKAAATVIEWQNLFDPTIWEAGRQIGIPPRLIKVLVEQESQFWPGNSRNAPFEYGLGQLSQAGVDVTLRWDNELSQQVCNSLFYDCNSPYGRMPSWLQGSVRGGFLSSIDTNCPNCINAIDLNKAEESIPFIARTMRANCRQVKYSFDIHKLPVPSYEDLWKFTFMSYHSGYQCLSEALDFIAFDKTKTDWNTVIDRVKCTGAKTYVENTWKSLAEFDNYRLKPTDRNRPATLVTFSPTPAPTLTPTPILAFSHVRVLVYVDKNGNNQPDPDELVDGTKVEVRIADGTRLTGITSHGEAIIDLTGHPVGLDAIVSLPDVYRSQKIRVLQEGEIPVIFRLDQPVLPPGLP